MLPHRFVISSSFNSTFSHPQVRRTTHRTSNIILSTPLRAFTSASQQPRRLDLHPDSKSTSGAPAKSDKLVENTAPISDTPEPVSPAQTSLPTSTASRLANELRKRASGTTETYIAYGATQKLFNECSRAGNYTVPQIDDGGIAPKNDAGEDLGVGTGWWYDCNISPYIYKITQSNC
jgi:cytochrome b pre-mRNA-processing protein 3